MQFHRTSNIAISGESFLSEPGYLYRSKLTSLELLQVLKDNKFMIIEGLVILLLFLLFTLLFSLHFEVASIHRNVGLRYRDIHVSRSLWIVPAGLDR